MHLQAVEGLDQYDQPTLPRWLSYLELNSLQPQSKFKLSQDIVGKKAEYKWDFHFTSSESGEAVLSWPAADQLNLKLLDLASNQLIDMTQTTQHTMAMDGGSSVSILYSEDPTEDFDEYVFDASAVYPNPTEDLLSLSIQVPRGESEADASVQLFNGAGKVLWEGQEAFAEGRHDWTISLRDYPEGVLFYNLSILTKSNAQGHSRQSWTSTGKIVLRK